MVRPIPQVWNATSFSRVVLVVDFWHPELATPADRAAVLDPPRLQRYESIFATHTFERADTVPASDLAAHPSEGREDRGAAGAAEDGKVSEGLRQQSAEGRTSGVGGVARHCVGLSAHVLGANGMCTLERCVSAVLGGDHGSITS